MSANSELSIEAHSSSSEKPSSSSTSAKTVFEQVDSSQSTHRDHDVETVNEPEDSSSTSIPPADGGKGAWMFLAGCFIFEALVWGFPFSFGVFQSYYTTHPPFSLHPAGIAAIGTCSSGVMYLFAPVTLYALESFPSIRRLSSIIGLAIAVMALIASSFATKVWLLILTQGVLYAIGGSLLYSPTMFYLDEWFVRKKGLAFGIMWAGVGTSGLIFPFLLSYLLAHLGHATTLRIWSLILLLLCAPLIHYVRPRLPASTALVTRQPISYSFFWTRTHIFLQASNVLESLGFFIPAIYLPSYAASLNMPAYTGTLLLALLNLFSVFGAIGLGHLCDRHHVVIVILISTIGATISVFLFWGFGTGLPLLVLFVASYGFFAGGYSAIWTGMMKEVRKTSPETGMGTLMGVFAAGRGIGAVASGPLSEVLLSRVGGGSVSGGKGWGFGTEYGVLIVFTGVSAFAGIVAVGAWKRGGGVVDEGEVGVDGERDGDDEGGRGNIGLDVLGD
ncbi:related to monocarboxylate transporter 2 [Phialocephala subalpina]|uniref:Related to monocarboxylate transporter 2 n=1 Tax=Phialocephala subalpina TaxID=576137 RepID=A0A1L7WHI1_9HELO|nr:related to monocarboxylate transporter 2 [Phialocephala subalpina]